MKKKEVKTSFLDGISIVEIVMLSIFSVFLTPCTVAIVRGMLEGRINVLSWGLILIIVFLFCSIFALKELISVIKTMIERKKFIFASSSLGDWGFNSGAVEIIKLKNGQIFIFDSVRQVLLNAAKDDLEKKFSVLLPCKIKRGECECENKISTRDVAQIEIDETVKVDLPISLNIVLDKDINLEELWKIFEEYSKKHHITGENWFSFRSCLFETLLSHKDNKEKIIEAMRERLSEKITLLEMKEKIINSISFPKILSAFSEIVIDTEDILISKKRNILEK